MREVVIRELEAGQRLDKFLHKYLKDAPNSFLFKMMRKKNIVLNGKKAVGSEILSQGDCVKFFLAEETIEKFMGVSNASCDITKLYRKAFECLKGIEVVAEFDDVLFLKKPSGILSQRADATEFSANEWLIGYLLQGGKMTAESLNTFKPSVCNRLDRNTSGLLVCSKTLVGSQEMARVLKDRSIHKFYRCVVKGKCELQGIYEGFLYKNEKNNKVTVYDSIEAVPADIRTVVKTIKTGVKVVRDEDCIWPKNVLQVATGRNVTELEIELFTGKTHQIRAQMEKLSGEERHNRRLNKLEG